MDAIKGRRSVRKFRPGDIKPREAEALVDALVWAPSAGNLESRCFYFVYNPSVKEKLAGAAYGQNFISEAPLVVVGCADSAIAGHYGRRGMELYSIQDVACAVENMMLAAHAMGLGSVWVGAFDEAEAAVTLSLPDNLRPVAIVPVGRPDESPPAPERAGRWKGIKEIR